MKKGKLWIVEFPRANGHEQFGTRPVLMLADTESNIIIVILLTSNLQALRFPYTLEIEPSKQNGIKEKSVALVFQIRAIDKKRLRNKIGNLERITLKRIDRMLKNLLQI